MQPMKVMLSALVMLGLITVVSGTAGAIGVTFPGGPFVAQVTDFSVATTYDGTLNDGGVKQVFTASGYYDLATHTNHLILPPWYPASVLNLTPEAGMNDLFPGESWGIFSVNTISPGALNPAKNGVDGPSGPAVWNTSAANGQVVGVIELRKDQLVQLVANSSGVLDGTHGTQNFQSVGGTFYLYNQPLGFYDPNFGPGGRIMSGPNTGQYKGVGFDQSGNPIGTLLAVGHEATGFYPINGSGTPDDPNTTFMSQFDVAGSTGSAEFYLDVDPNLGTLGKLLNTNGFPTIAPLPGAPGKTPDGLGTYETAADLHLIIDDTPTVTGSQYGGAPWSITSNDPLQGITPVPEPLTMLGVVLGVGGLARYVRRRLAA
jgi:hypothetical protein